MKTSFIDRIFGVDHRPKTGKSSITFTIENDPDSEFNKLLCSELAIDSQVSLRYDMEHVAEDDRIAVCFGGAKIGWVEKKHHSKILFMMIERKLEFCVITAFEPALTCTLYFKKENGREVMPKRYFSQIKWAVVDEALYNGKADENYLECLPSMERLNRNLAMYGMTTFSRNDSENAYWYQHIRSDDYFLEYFIHQLTCGFIRSKEDLKEYYAHVKPMRSYGDNFYLRKRINKYLLHHMIVLD